MKTILGLMTLTFALFLISCGSKTKEELSKERIELENKNRLERAKDNIEKFGEKVKDNTEELGEKIKDKAEEIDERIKDKAEEIKK